MDEFPKALLTAVGSRYRFERLLGEGGMGRVYVAQDLKHDRRVAIKTIQPDFTSDSARERFGREIKVTARLQHPHILPLLDSGVVGDLLYYVMPFVEGESLRERLDREKQLPIADALQIAREVADALECAHEQDIVHRDVKPANVLLSGGHVLVMDFGIARAASKTSGVTLTGTGMSIGTPLYMSPEQATDASAADARSDIYSLGCVLYEMLAGQPPFTGPTVESIIRQHLSIDPPTVTNYRPSVPADLLPIFDRTLAKAPADRFRRAGELSEALAAAGRVTTGAAAPAPGRGLNPLLAVLIYLVGGWAALQIVDRLSEAAGLPEWVMPFALVLLMIGLPVIGVTAIIQWKSARGSPRAVGAARAGAITPRPGRRGRSGTVGVPAASSSARLFTWRNAIAGGVLALALWGLVAISWLVWFQNRGQSGPQSSTADTGAGVTDPVAVVSGGEPQSAGATAGGEGPTGADPTTAGGPIAAGDPTDAAADPGRPLPEPAPPPARGGAPDAGAAATARARDRAETALTAAEGAGARALGSAVLARADSLWNQAVQAEAEGRHGDAARTFEVARVAFGDAERTARATWTARLDSARRSVDSLRQRADRAAAPFADAERLHTDATRLEADREYASALATLERAGRTYERALPAVELPPAAGDPTPAEGDPRPTEPEPPQRTPEERIRAVMDRLERAFESEDLAAVQSVWVNLTSRQVEEFRDFFADSRDLDYEYGIVPGSIQTTGDAIDFTVRIRWNFDLAGDSLRRDLSQTYRLIESAAGDVLRSR